MEFSNVEELLGFCEDPEQGSPMAGRVARQYLTDFATSKHPLSAAMVRCNAVKSYFAVHDVRMGRGVDRKRHAVHDARDLPEAGLHASTFAGRFNFEGYPQVARHFRIEECEAWDLDRCPVPVRLVRAKTGTAYTAFIDRDAVSHLQDCLGWKEFQAGRRHDPAEPMFVTRRGAPVNPDWISHRFSMAALDAGIQRKASRRVFKIHSHEVRDLLKSTLLTSGCAQYAADHVLGHAPRDSYEKQAALYPEKLRNEYAKASGHLNIFSGIERHLKGECAAGPAPPEGAVEAGRGTSAGVDGYRRMEAQQRIMWEELQRITGAMADMLRIVAAGRGVSLDDVPDDAVRRLMGLDEYGGEDE